MNLQDLRDALYDHVGQSPDQGLLLPTEVDRLLHTAHMRLSSFIVAQKEDFFSFQTTISEVAGQESYPLPTQFQRLIFLERLKSSGGEELVIPVPLRRVRRDQLSIYALAEIGVWGNPGPVAFYLRGQGTVVLVPKPTLTQTDSLRLTFTFRPAKMIAQNDMPFQLVSGPASNFSDVLEEYHDIIWMMAAEVVFGKEESSNQASHMKSLIHERLNELQQHLISINQAEPRVPMGPPMDPDWEDGWL